MVNFHCLFFVCFVFFLITKRHPYRWGEVVSWLNYLVLVVDQWGNIWGSLPLIHQIYISLTSYPQCCIPCFPFLYASMARIILTSLKHDYPVTSRIRIIIAEFNLSGFIVVGLNTSGFMLRGFWKYEFSFSEKSLIHTP